MNGREPACQCRRHGDAGLILGSRKSPGGGHGNPSQYACLESLMDRGAWWAAVHGAAKGWTWLKWLSRHQLWTVIFRRFPWALLQPQCAWGFPGANGLSPSRAYFFYLVPRIPCPEPQAYLPLQVSSTAASSWEDGAQWARIHCSPWAVWSTDMPAGDRCKRLSSWNDYAIIKFSFTHIYRYIHIHIYTYTCMHTSYAWTHVQNICIHVCTCIHIERHTDKYN